MDCEKMMVLSEMFDAQVREGLPPAVVDKEAQRLNGKLLGLGKQLASRYGKERFSELVIGLREKAQRAAEIQGSIDRYEKEIKEKQESNAPEDVLRCRELARQLEGEYFRLPDQVLNISEHQVLKVADAIAVAKKLDAYPGVRENLTPEVKVLQEGMLFDRMVKLREEQRQQGMLQPSVTVRSLEMQARKAVKAYDFVAAQYGGREAFKEMVEDYKAAGDESLTSYAKRLVECVEKGEDAVKLVDILSMARKLQQDEVMPFTPTKVSKLAPYEPPQSGKFSDNVRARAAYTLGPQLYHQYTRAANNVWTLLAKQRNKGDGQPIVSEVSEEKAATLVDPVSSPLLDAIRVQADFAVTLATQAMEAGGQPDAQLGQFNALMQKCIGILSNDPGATLPSLSEAEQKTLNRQVDEVNKLVNPIDNEYLPPTPENLPVLRTMDTVGRALGATVAVYVTQLDQPEINVENAPRLAGDQPARDRSQANDASRPAVGEDKDYGSRPRTNPAPNVAATLRSIAPAPAANPMVAALEEQEDKLNEEMLDINRKRKTADPEFSKTLLRVKQSLLKVHEGLVGMRETLSGLNMEEAKVMTAEIARTQALSHVKALFQEQLNEATTAVGVELTARASTLGVSFDAPTPKPTVRDPAKDGATGSRPSQPQDQKNSVSYIMSSLPKTHQTVGPAKQAYKSVEQILEKQVKALNSARLGAPDEKKAAYKAARECIQLVVDHIWVLRGKLKAEPKPVPAVSAAEAKEQALEEVQSLLQTQIHQANDAAVKDVLQGAGQTLGLTVSVSPLTKPRKPIKLPPPIQNHFAKALDQDAARLESRVNEMEVELNEAKTIEEKASINVTLVALRGAADQLRAEATAEAKNPNPVVMPVSVAKIRASNRAITVVRAKARVEEHPIARENLQVIVKEIEQKADPVKEQDPVVKAGPVAWKPAVRSDREFVSKGKVGKTLGAVKEKQAAEKNSDFTTGQKVAIGLLFLTGVGAIALCAAACLGGLSGGGESSPAPPSGANGLTSGGGGKRANAVDAHKPVQPSVALAAKLGDEGVKAVEHRVGNVTMMYKGKMYSSGDDIEPVKLPGMRGG